MNLIEELSKKVYIGQYNTMTFYREGIPTVTVKVIGDKDIFIITNNMEDLNAHIVYFDGNVYEFANEVFNILIKDEVDVRGVESITFHDGLFIHGRIEKDRIIIIQPDEGGDDVEHVINVRSGLSELMIAEIVNVFVGQYFS